MSYAIIETGGKQLRVEPGRFYDIELLHVDPEAQVSIDKVLFVQHNGDVTIGQPFIEGATVEGTVMRHRRGKKVIVYKMRPKKKTRKKRGHRQEITQLMINSINLNGSVIASEQEAQDQAQATATTPVAQEPAVETIAPQETTSPVAEEAQAAEIAPVAEVPATVSAVPEETTATATPEAPAADTTPVADEPDAQTIEPDEAQEPVESVAAEDPDAETAAPEGTTEGASE